LAKGGSIDPNGQPFAQTLGPGRTAVRPPSRKRKHQIEKAVCCEKKRGVGSSFFIEPQGGKSRRECFNDLFSALSASLRLKTEKPGELPSFDE
jgi:hypothetical protein